jgi:ketosteroid isomerase-like protein
MCHDVNRKYVLNNRVVRAMVNDERAICDLLDAFTRAIYLKDSVGAIAPLADDAVTFDLAPPLQQGPEVTHDPDRLEEWFATWKGPIVSEPGERTIVVDDNVAYAYGLQRMTGTKTNGEKVELWFRATACFRRDNGEWRITHMHNSVPFAMDGSERALLGLKP